MNVKEIVMQLALDQFINELKNPSSNVTKKFNTMLYGDPVTGTKGLFDTFTSYTLPDAVEKEKRVQAELDRYKRSGGQIAGDAALTAASALGKGAGNVISKGSSLLGSALSSMGKGGGRIQNPLAPILNAAGGALAAGGAAIGGAASTVGNALDAIHKDIVSNREKEREAELLIRERPSGAFYDARRKLTTGVKP